MKVSLICGMAAPNPLLIYILPVKAGKLIPRSHTASLAARLPGDKVLANALYVEISSKRHPLQGKKSNITNS